MKITSKTFENLSYKYYSFAFGLLPDELMATQLLIDSVTKISVMNRDQLKEEDISVALDPRKLELDFLKGAFELSKIRFEHFKDSRQLNNFDHSEKNSSFFLLGIEERAALYLKDKYGFSFKDTAYILGTSYEETLALIHRVRAEFLDLNDHSTQQGGIHGL
ncbi:MAG: hypothetical protein CME63_03320 [Halobacteriovoraceae bacterium]|nr:hypothetical protein [Halobacteriovoraceae bacterium]MBC96751.1 hypothetical protein [Halobacteriovoraceae bacterium]